MFTKKNGKYNEKIGMTGGMAKYWIIPRVGDKELPRVGHLLASCSLLISYVLMFFLKGDVRGGQCGGTSYTTSMNHVSVDLCICC